MRGSLGRKPGRATQAKVRAREKYKKCKRNEKRKIDKKKREKKRIEKGKKNKARKVENPQWAPWQKLEPKK